MKLSYTITHWVRGSMVEVSYRGIYILTQDLLWRQAFDTIRKTDRVPDPKGV